MKLSHPRVIPLAARPLQSLPPFPPQVVPFVATSNVVLPVRVGESQEVASLEFLDGTLSSQYYVQYCTKDSMPSGL